ncbi:hypothetical protein ACIBTV_27105 [Micromonospora sp. NPDC049366]|uniref:phosphatase domain-containing protein n=1 Tax=Micromonospora sp. NPDC049366 TaxID=3364271 RepID=UPI003789A415
MQTPATRRRPKVTIVDTLVPYRPVPGTPVVVLVDIDGTVALKVDRSPYDMTRVLEDGPNRPVILVVRAMHAAGYGVIFCSGRDESARADTMTWLDRHVQVPYLALYMRRLGDGRRDSVVKQEFFNEHIRKQYDVLGVFDDREQVVRMWRANGLTVFQVAEGSF